ncbi:MAG: hypothetical protein NZM38_03870 [Cytophagales bacterium]|nr:hypothetical protein [Cytophagales bacterium]MDW8383889.1 hypothetical protein [Flammeovirgaceae bacterium]
MKLLIIALGISISTYAGNPFTKTYGGKGYDEANAIIKVKSGGYLIAGKSSSYSNGNIDLNLIRIDDNGKVIWNKTYGGDNAERALDVIETPKGEFIAVGGSDSYGAGEDITDFWVIKVDANGNLIWEKTFGTHHSIEEAYGIVETGDGHYIIVGTTTTFEPEEIPSEILVVKIDENGNKIWEKRYGGESSEEGASICRSLDGNFTIVGSTESFGNGKWDFWMFQIDKDGKKLWDKTFGGGDNDMANHVTCTSDGGYILTGYSYSFATAASLDLWVVRTDSKGEQIWAKAFGGLSTDEGHSVIETKKGDIVVCGYTEVWKPNKENVNTSPDLINMYVIKMDKNGNKIWEQSLGGIGNQHGFDLVEAADEGIVVVGNTDTNDEGGSECLLMKLSPNGAPAP